MYVAAGLCSLASVRPNHVGALVTAVLRDPSTSVPPTGVPSDCLLANLQFIVDNQNQLVELGSGAHAAVYLGRLHGERVAIKVHSGSRLPGQQDCSTSRH